MKLSEMSVGDIKGITVGGITLGFVKLTETKIALETGVIENVWKDMDVGIVRLPKEMRAALEGVGAVAKEEEKAYKEYLKAKQRYEKVTEKTQKAINVRMQKVKNQNTKIGPRDIESVVQEYLMKTLRDMYNHIHVTVRQNKEGQLMCEVDYVIDIAKYPRESSYPYLYLEYDNVMCVMYDMPAYKEDVKNRTKGLRVLDFGGARDRRKASIDMGDKYLSLTVEQQIVIPKSYLQGNKLKEVLTKGLSLKPYK